MSPLARSSEMSIGETTPLNANATNNGIAAAAADDDDDDEMNKPLNILVEIVSAYDIKTNPQRRYSSLAKSTRNLLSSTSFDTSANSSHQKLELNPYCVVKHRGKTLHTTATIEKTCNPVWTIKTKCLFLFKTSASEIIRPPPPVGTPPQDDSLIFHLLSKKPSTVITIPGAANPDLYLGRVVIDLSGLLEKCNEERYEYPLSGCGKHGGGSLALRFRFATPDDVRFVRKLSFHLKRPDKGSFLGHENPAEGGQIHERYRDRKMVKLHTDKDELGVAGRNVMNMFTQQSFYRNKRRDGVTYVLTRPFPDPRRVKETTFLSKLQLDHECSLPSHNWIEAGSGTLGKVHLEILSCHGLPNLDAGEAVGNYTDAFVCAVFEDAVVETCVIDDELSPRWLPWTQRAFTFHMIHPTSILYLGVFDYDLGILGHEHIGRVAVNLEDFVKDTVYTLSYDLYASSDVTDRTPNGSITIRLRLEIPDEKLFIKESFKPRPSFYVNVKKEKSFDVIRYTCYGEHYNPKFDLTVFKSYINEIFEYKSNLAYSISDSFQSLIFWRGQVLIPSLGNQLLPLHSLVAFVTLTHVIEYPHLRLPFTFFCMAWIMIACRTSRQVHPSPWYKGKPFFYFVECMWKGSYSKSVRVEQGENEEEAAEYELMWKDRLERDQREREQRAELQMVLDNLGNEHIATNMDAGLSIELLERLARYQGYIKRICVFFRYIKLILSWEEAHTAFRLTSIFLSLSVVTLFIPWRFILYHMTKLLIWTFLGPWMKILDFYLTAKKQTQEERRKSLSSPSFTGNNSEQCVLNNFVEKMRMARIKGEEAEKLKAMKMLKFGSYITEVPAYNLARHYDRPLPESFAYNIHQSDMMNTTHSRAIITVTKDETAGNNDGGFVPGQQLHGVMIPRPESEVDVNHDVAIKEMERLISLREKKFAVTPTRGSRTIQRLSRILTGTSISKLLQSELNDEEKEVGGFDADSAITTFHHSDSSEEDELGYEVVVSNLKTLEYALNKDRRLTLRLMHPSRIYTGNNPNPNHDDDDTNNEPLVPEQCFISRNNLEFLIPANRPSNRSLVSSLCNDDISTIAEESSIVFVNRNCDNLQSRCTTRDETKHDDRYYEHVVPEEGVEVVNLNDETIMNTAITPITKTRKQKNAHFAEIAEGRESEEEHSEELSTLYRHSDHVMVAFCNRQ